MSKYLVVLLVPSMSLVYAAADQPGANPPRVQTQIKGAVNSWQGGRDMQGDDSIVVSEGGIFSEGGEDCFSGGDLSEKGEGKGKPRMPSLRKLAKAGYGFFIAAVQNVSSSTGLTVRRSQGNERIVKSKVPMGDGYPISTRAPKVPGHLTIFDDSNSEQPLWTIYQGLYRKGESEKKGLFVQRRAEPPIRILGEALLPQIVALKVSQKEIQLAFPGGIDEYKKKEGILTRLSASLPSLPSLFSDDSPSSSSSSLVTKEEESVATDKLSYDKVNYNERDTKKDS